MECFTSISILIEAEGSSARLRFNNKSRHMQEDLHVHEELISKNCEKFTLKEPACGDILPLEIPWSQTGLAAASCSGGDG